MKIKVGMVLWILPAVLTVQTHSATEPSFTQKALKPYIKQQCGAELTQSKIWQIGRAHV